MTVLDQSRCFQDESSPCIIDIIALFSSRSGSVQRPREDCKTKGRGRRSRRKKQWRRMFRRARTSFRRARSAPDNKKEKAEEANIQNEVKPTTLGKNKIRCPDGKVKRFNVLPKCRIDGVDSKETEWSYVAYLKSKNCPKFSKTLKKAVMYCYFDQNPCKEYNDEEVKEAFQLCQKAEAKKEEEKENPDSEQDEPDAVETKVGKNCKPLDTQIDEDFEFPLYNRPKKIHEGWLFVSWPRLDKL